MDNNSEREIAGDYVAERTNECTEGEEEEQSFPSQVKVRQGAEREELTYYITSPFPPIIQILPQQPAGAQACVAQVISNELKSKLVPLASFNRGRICMRRSLLLAFFRAPAAAAGRGRGFHWIV